MTIKNVDYYTVNEKSKNLLLAENELIEKNAWLENRTAEQRVRWALENLPESHCLSSSFGIQSAVMLHMVTRLIPDIPVVLIDTGYLFPETYLFIDKLVNRLGINLKVYRPVLSPAWQEARDGRLWEAGKEGLDTYNKFNKVEPMQRALRDLSVQTWFAGIRRSQSESRVEKPVLEAIKGGRLKVHPIVDWHNKDVHRYLLKHDLPYHPLWEKNYVSVGDIHTSQPLKLGMREEETRYFGLQRECGLHE